LEKGSNIVQESAQFRRKLKIVRKGESRIPNGGRAEFPPETPLPPRPHFCWPFWELRGQMQKVRGAKKRGRGRVERKKMKYISLLK